MAKRVFLFVLEGLGIGALPDAHTFGDQAAHTLAAVAASPDFQLPNLQALGLLHIAGAPAGAPAQDPLGSYARLGAKAVCKESTSAHWELAGVITQQAPPLYPQGFPEHLLDSIYAATFARVICNRPSGGMQALYEYGREHIRTGKLILYTSTDSVLQLAAHEIIVPPRELHEIGKAVRGIMQWQHAVARVVVRPFTGDPPDGYTCTAAHWDYSLPPPADSMLDQLSRRWLDVIAVGRAYSAFAGHGITRTLAGASVADTMQQVCSLAEQRFSGFCLASVAGLDRMYTHKGDIHSYARALSEFDSALGQLAQQLQPDDIVLVTGDLGCDTALPGAEYSREYVPMLAFGQKVRKGCDLGTLETSADVAATIQEYFALPVQTAGRSFLHKIYNP